MGKVIIYDEENMVHAAKLLDNVTATGIKNFRMLAEIANILDSGKRGEYNEQKEELENGMDSEKIQPD